MKETLASVLMLLMLSSNLLAQGGANRPLYHSAMREAGRLSLTAANPPQQDAAPAQERSWPARHPVLLGTLVGFGVGFAIGAATCRYPTAEGSSCSDWTYPGNARMLGGLTIGGFGAGIGAVVGWLASR